MTFTVLLVFSTSVYIRIGEIMANIAVHQDAGVHRQEQHTSMVLAAFLSVWPSGEVRAAIPHDWGL